MKIAVLSGKGGTGKTFVSVNLAATGDAMYIDCDVEEPNGHLFFKPKSFEIKNVSVKVPVVDEKLCNGCRKCVDFCKFNAMAKVGNRVIIFDEICHSCGACLMLCPQGALWEKEKKIGEVQKGESYGNKIVTGILNTGEPSGVPIIKELLKQGFDYEKDIFIDCPPGSACIVMESIKDADYCLLVAEPTLFGVHNLSMVHELVTRFNKPYGVVLNKCIEYENIAKSFCIENGLNILCEIPFNTTLGELNSNGLIAVKEYEEYRNIFERLLKNIKEGVAYETVVSS